MSRIKFLPAQDVQRQFDFALEKIMSGVVAVLFRLVGYFWWITLPGVDLGVAPVWSRRERRQHKIELYAFARYKHTIRRLRDLISKPRRFTQAAMPMIKF